MTDVLAFSESASLASELATAGALVAGGGKSLSVELDSQGQSHRSGPALVLKSEEPLEGDSELIASALAEVAKSRHVSVILLGSTKLGRMVAGRLSVLAGMPVLTDVRGVATDGSKLTGTRGVYAGKFVASVESSLPCVALVPQGSYERWSGSPGDVEEVAVSVPPSRVKRTATVATRRSSVDLRSAKIIVSAGRGFRKKEDLELAEKLATALGGMLGASRPLSSDLGWLGEEYHIGLTGVYVRPDLYLAVGISGQLQHVAGIRDSKVIAAINKDKQAPIFQVADYGVVGDLYEVVPALIRILGAGQPP